MIARCSIILNRNHVHPSLPFGILVCDLHTRHCKLSYRINTRMRSSRLIIVCIDRVGSIKDKCSTLKKRLRLLGWNVNRCVGTNMLESFKLCKQRFLSDHTNPCSTWRAPQSSLSFHPFLWIDLERIMEYWRKRTFPSRLFANPSRGRDTTRQ